jgi:hypothetical protein
MRNPTMGVGVTSRRGFSLGAGTARAWEVGFRPADRAWEVGFASTRRAWEVGIASSDAGQA